MPPRAPGCDNNCDNPNDLMTLGYASGHFRAQAALTPASEAEGRRFEFCLGHHLFQLVRSVPPQGARLPSPWQFEENKAPANSPSSWLLGVESSQAGELGYAVLFAVDWPRARGSRADPSHADRFDTLSPSESGAYSSYARRCHILRLMGTSMASVLIKIESRRGSGR